MLRHRVPSGVCVKANWVPSEREVPGLEGSPLIHYCTQNVAAGSGSLQPSFLFVPSRRGDGVGVTEAEGSHKNYCRPIGKLTSQDTPP